MLLSIRPTLVVRVRRSAALAAVRFSQPSAKRGNLRALSSGALSHRSGGDGGASRDAPASTPIAAVQRSSSGAPFRKLSSQSQKGQIAGVDPSEMSDERTKKDGEAASAAAGSSSSIFNLSSDSGPARNNMCASDLEGFLVGDRQFRRAPRSSMFNGCVNL